MNWSTPETVSGFARGAPNPTLMAFAAREYARGGRRVLDIGCGAARALALDEGLDDRVDFIAAAMDRLPVADRST